MKFLDIFSYVVIALTLLITGLVIAHSATWSPTLSGTLAWLTQAFSFGLLIVAATCLICKNNVRDLAPWTIFWAVFISGFVMLATICVNSAMQKDLIAWTSIAELAVFLGIQTALFILPRAYYYD